jgi:hypothetical protein
MSILSFSLKKPIVTRKFNHFGLWISCKINFENLEYLLYRNDNSENLNRLKNFLINYIYYKNVPNYLFCEEKSFRCSALELYTPKNDYYINTSRFSKLVEEGLELVQEEKINRHYAVLTNILTKYPFAIAIEVPVWRIIKGINNSKHVTGHIDLITLNDEKEDELIIFDYKPNLDEILKSKEEYSKVYNQIYIYKLLLSHLTNINKEYLKIGLFDEKIEVMMKNA